MSDESHIMNIMKDAAYQRECERYDEINHVTNIVLGKAKFSTRRVGEVIKLGDDYLVEMLTRIPGADVITWMCVIRDKSSNWYFETQDEAILYLLACRHGAEPLGRDGVAAAFYAGRVLGISRKDEAQS